MLRIAPSSPFYMARQPQQPAAFQLPVEPPCRLQALNALILLLDTLQSERERGLAIEAFLAFCWRAWAWNPETFHRYFLAAKDHGAA